MVHEIASLSILIIIINLRLFYSILVLDTLEIAGPHSVSPHSCWIVHLVFI